MQKKNKTKQPSSILHLSKGHPTPPPPPPQPLPTPPPSAGQHAVPFHQLSLQHIPPPPPPTPCRFFQVYLRSLCVLNDKHISTPTHFISTSVPPPPNFLPPPTDRADTLCVFHSVALPFPPPPALQSSRPPNLCACALLCFARHHGTPWTPPPQPPPSHRPTLLCQRSQLSFVLGLAHNTRRTMTPSIHTLLCCRFMVQQYKYLPPSPFFFTNTLSYPPFLSLSLRGVFLL